MTCCERCSGKGAVGWVSLATAAGPNGLDHLKESECSVCHGTGGWTGAVPKGRMTLNDIRKLLLAGASNASGS